MKALCIAFNTSMRQVHAAVNGLPPYNYYRRIPRPHTNRQKSSPRIHEILSLEDIINIKRRGKREYWGVIAIDYGISMWTVVSIVKGMRTYTDEKLTKRFGDEYTKMMENLNGEG